MKTERLWRYQYEHDNTHIDHSFSVVFASSGLCSISRELFHAWIPLKLRRTYIFYAILNFIEYLRSHQILIWMENVSFAPFCILQRFCLSLFSIFAAGRSGKIWKSNVELRTQFDWFFRNVWWRWTYVESWEDFNVAMTRRRNYKN